MQHRSIKKSEKRTKPKKTVLPKTYRPNEKQVQEVYRIMKSMTQNCEGCVENKPDDFDMFGDGVSQ
jgi:predicted transcriptional regulator with HTH domain